MGNTRMRAQMEHEGEVEGESFNEVADSVADEMLDIELTHNSTSHLGGQARIRIGPITASFTSIVLLDDEVSLKGAIGKTLMRIERGTDVAESLVKFAKENNGDINFIRSEYGDTE